MTTKAPGAPWVTSTGTSVRNPFNTVNTSSGTSIRLGIDPYRHTMNNMDSMNNNMSPFDSVEASIAAGPIGGINMALVNLGGSRMPNMIEVKTFTRDDFVLIQAKLELFISSILLRARSANTKLTLLEDGGSAIDLVMQTDRLNKILKKKYEIRDGLRIFALEDRQAIFKVLNEIDTVKGYFDSNDPTNTEIGLNLLLTLDV